ncbi:tRNA uridine(34) 5-carboxymethylaminomethyl modification radical SAM/GNAT enzyme Elp3 [Candidatus Woesearchaeota archaeon]|nr:tRNA uridine(34) 5-carboxymethylaminomethyl modification radical SAM/GNAT enzyme Elp3 [Candidatus Woesearchaeota archaeon]
MNLALIQEIQQELPKIKTKKELEKLKSVLSKKYKLNRNLSNIDLLSNIKNPDFKILLTKPVRTISGVTPISIMSKPANCPSQAKCIYCPGGINSVFGNTPKSYPGNSPGIIRAIRNDYDPYLQVFNRLEHYVLLNHDITKVEFIVMGSTFLFFDNKYKEDFIKFCLKALNDFSGLFVKNNQIDFGKFTDFFELPASIKDKERIKRIKGKLLKLKSDTTLEKEQSRNENTYSRCVAMCLETRPDYSFEEHISEMLMYGTTRVEIGVQTLSQEIMEKIKRGHTTQDSIKATQLLKDSFLKVTYHNMLNLTGSTIENDKYELKEIFENPDYRPDSLKIYPCLVFKGTELYDIWKQGNHKVFSTEEIIDIICEAKKYIPKYCRIMRVNRDIPTFMSEAGVRKTNLRQYIDEELKKRKVKCSCIRCREPKLKQISWENVKLLRQDYEASKGREIFLSYEDTKNDILLGFVRLRIPYKQFRPEITNRSAGIRELHVYGQAVRIGEKDDNVQHKGLGISLMQEAEKIAKEEYNVNKILVISGIGVRNYYINKLGYKKDGPYVSKLI